jgi:hypothetical protein
MAEDDRKEFVEPQALKIEVEKPQRRRHDQATYEYHGARINGGAVPRTHDDR